MKPSKINKDNCQKAYQLRSLGHTYLQIGQALGMSEPYARHLVQINSVIQQRQAIWTDGLSSRVSNAIRYAGFTSKAQVIAAFNNDPERIKNCMDLGHVGLKELRSWAGVDE